MNRLMITGTIAALALLFVSAAVTTTAHAAHDTTTIDDSASVSTQSQDEPPRDDVESQRVDIQVWTVLAAGGAAALGLVLFVVRVAMGWVKPPPPQEDAQH